MALIERGMSIMQLLWVWFVLGYAISASAATDPTASDSAGQLPSATQNDADDDDEDDWIFDSAPYTDNPKTGERVEQYAPEKPVYRNTPRNYSPMPHNYGGDPFFLPNTDMIFFQNSPNPFYAEPLDTPTFYNNQFGSPGNSYGQETGGEDPSSDMSK